MHSHVRLLVKCALGAESCGYVIHPNTKSHLQDCCKLHYITFLFLSLVSCYRSIIGCESSIVCVGANGAGGETSWWRIV